MKSLTWHAPMKFRAVAVAATLAIAMLVLPASPASAATVDNIGVTDVTANDATLTWDAYPDAVEYRIFWSTSSSGMSGACEPNCTRITPTDLENPSVTLAAALAAKGQSVTAGQYYYVKISAIDAGGRTITGWQSTPTTVDLVGDPVAPPEPEPIPDTVQNIRFESISANDANILWDKVPTAEKYRVFWSTSSSGMSGRCEPNCTKVTPTDLENPSVTLAQAFAAVSQSVTTGQTYYVKISAINASGSTITGWQSTPAAVNLTGDPVVIPDTVQNIRFESVTANDANILWDKVPTAEKYRVFWSTSSSGMSGRCEPNCTKVTPTDLEDPSVTLADALAAVGQPVRSGQTYYVKISAINASGSTITSWQSTPAAVNLTGSPETIPDTVQNIRFESIGDADATILWDKVPTATNYRVYWSHSTHKSGACEPTCTVITPDDFESPAVQLADVLAAEGATVQAGSAYYIKVSAIEGSGTITGWQDVGEKVQLTGALGTPQAVLQDLVSNGSGTSASATATFATPTPGQATELQVYLPEDDNNHSPDWRREDTGTQDGSGKTTFSFSSPLQSKHLYRVVSGSTVSNEVEFKPNRASKNTGLSTIYIDTNDGHSVDTRSHYFYGSFEMTGSSKLAKCTKVDPVDMKVKGRGNYSWSFSKKSFTLSLDKKTSLCGMTKDKKFALIANAYDKSLLRGATAFTIGSKLTNMAWTPQFAPVDLYINGSYRGSYQLLERIDVDSDRVDIDELKTDGNRDSSTPEGAANNVSPGITGGYLLEWDFRKGGDHNITAGSRGWVGIKSPEDEDGTEGISNKQISYINSYVDAADKALFGSNFKSSTSGYRKYIDVDSAIDFWIGQEIMKPVDGLFWASVYMYKPRNGKLFMGPMWDYDLSSGSAARAGNTVSSAGWYLRYPVNTSAKQSSKTWLNRMFEDPYFANKAKARWRQVYPQLKTVHSFIDSQKPIMASSVSENFKKWNINERMSSVQQIKGSYSAEFSYLHSWIVNRINWINSQIG